MQTLKAQLNVRLNPACVELIKLERQTLPGCHSDGEALESIIFRSAVSEEARQIIRRAAAREAAKDPLFVAAGLGQEAGVSSPTHQHPTGAETHSRLARNRAIGPGDLARRYEAAAAKTTKAPPTAAPAANEKPSQAKKASNLMSSSQRRGRRVAGKSPQAPPNAAPASGAQP